MSFAPRIRKQILRALNEHIIPQLQTQNALQVAMVPQNDFATLQHRPLYEPLLAVPKIDQLRVSTVWPEVGMQTCRPQLLGFIYEGISEECLGVTVEMAEGLRKSGLPLRAGVTGLKVPAPAAFYFPSDIPHGYGTYPFKTEISFTVLPLRFLRIEILQDEVMAQLYESDKGVTHPIQIGSPELAQIVTKYCAFLEAAHTIKTSNTQLLEVMLQIREALEHSKVIVCNSSWPPVIFQPSADTPLRQIEMCRRTVEYIQMHLHRVLTLHDLAGQAGVSTNHLNRVFAQVTGVTIMRFITLRRIEAAKCMLAQTDERISDIALLSGFASAESFSTVFHQHVGSSPREYRQRTR